MVAIGLVLVLGALLLQVWLVFSAAPLTPVRVEPLLPDAAETPVDARVELARRYAPWLLHETDEALGRMDVPAAMDFDGDRDATDAWEEMPRHALVPTVYYTVLGTQTHWFLTYHLYHPRDWTRLPLGLQDVHEGDGESMQVVVNRSSDEVVLVTAQAGRHASGYAPVLGVVRSGGETLRSDFEMQGGHPVFFVASQSHAVYGSRDPRAANLLASLRGGVVTYRPAAEGENASEPQPPYGGTEARYRLVSLPAFLDGTTDHPSLFTSTTRYDEDEFPRYHKGDRYSGPFGASRGTSPFAFGFGWRRGETGALFFDPAARYAEAFDIEGAWSREYTERPFHG